MGHQSTHLLPPLIQVSGDHSTRENGMQTTLSLCSPFLLTSYFRYLDSIPSSSAHLFFQLLEAISDIFYLFLRRFHLSISNLVSFSTYSVSPTGKIPTSRPVEHVIPLLVSRYTSIPKSHAQLHRPPSPSPNSPSISNHLVPRHLFVPRYASPRARPSLSSSTRSPSTSISQIHQVKTHSSRSSPLKCLHKHHPPFKPPSKSGATPHPNQEQHLRFPAHRPT